MALSNFASPGTDMRQAPTFEKPVGSSPTRIATTAGTGPLFHDAISNVCLLALYFGLDSFGWRNHCRCRMLTCIDPSGELIVPPTNAPRLSQLADILED